MVVVESEKYMIGYFDIYGIRGKHLNKVVCQVFQNICVCMDTYINIDIQRCPDK